jgi:hypothetical protein
MLLAGQMELDNVSSCRGTTATNGLLVAQTRTWYKRRKACTTAASSRIHIASTSVCWISMEKAVVMFLVAASVPDRKRQHIRLHLLFFWPQSAPCWYYKSLENDF